MVSFEANLFFCPTCARPVCRRALVFNMILGEEEDTYCPLCLAQRQGSSLEDFFTLAKHYVASRECFEKAWDLMKSPSECPLPDECAIKSCFASLQ